MNIINKYNDIVAMEIGKVYMIETKKGNVYKWLSYIKDGFFYFVDSASEINLFKHGTMFVTRGTVHSVKNILKEIKG